MGGEPDEESIRLCSRAKDDKAGPWLCCSARGGVPASHENYDDPVDIKKGGTPLLPPMQQATTFISLPSGEEVVTIPAIGSFGTISTLVIYSNSVKELSRVAIMPFSSK